MADNPADALRRALETARAARTAAQQLAAQAADLRRQRAAMDALGATSGLTERKG